MGEGPGPQTPLAGLRVVSLAELYPGPLATMILADLGADVVLVERSTGEPTRRYPGHFAALNRNKRSLAVDLKRPAGREALLAVVARADVLIEGFRPGVMERLGLGAEQLREQFPDLVYCSISGYGQTGPLSERGGHDLSMQATAGFVASGPDGGPPAPASAPLADLASGMFAAVGVLAALAGRHAHGRGATVDVSMVESLVAWRSIDLVSTLNDLRPSPYPPLDPGYGVYATAGGRPLCLSIAGEDHQWRALCGELDLADLADLDEAARELDRDRIGARVADALAERDHDEVTETLAKVGVGVAVVNDDEAVVAEPHLVARRVVTPVGDGSGLRVVRQPVVLDGQPGTVPRGVPGLGAHSREVLVDAGLAPAAVARLVADGVVLDGAS